jgi:hypothetical protein
MEVFMSRTWVGARLIKKHAVEKASLQNLNGRNAYAIREDQSQRYDDAYV